MRVSFLFFGTPGVIHGGKSMSIRAEVLPFLFAVIVMGLIFGALLKVAGAGMRTSLLCSSLLEFVLIFYMCFFFRDPDRIPPVDADAVLAGADGVVAAIKTLPEDEHLKCETIRISIFLSLFNVHVNRSPIKGNSTFLGYFPGKRLFTFDEKSSDQNQHNAILIEGDLTRCLLYQIVGPVCRRVVYWPDHDNAVPLEKGDRIGMMKFGSRLDMYFPAEDITVTARLGDKVRAGESLIARIKRTESS